MLVVVDILEKNVEKFGKIMILEMGKIISGVIVEVKKCVLVCCYYVEKVIEFLVDVFV